MPEQVFGLSVAELAIGLILVLLVLGMVFSGQRRKGESLAEEVGRIKDERASELSSLLMEVDLLLQNLPPKGAEATSYPYWIICEPPGRGRGGRPVGVHGFWDSREAAEKFLEERSYRFDPKTFVYCFSGSESDREVFLKRAHELREKIKGVL